MSTHSINTPNTSNKPSVIAFFDFDGTITRKDSFGAFFRCLLGRRFYVKLLQNLPYIIGYKCAIISNERAKEAILRSCVKGLSVEVINKAALDFLPILKKLCKQSAIEAINRHKDQGNKVV